MLRAFPLFFLLRFLSFSQKLPLESIEVQHTVIPVTTVIAVTQLTKGQPIDKSDMEAACAKLAGSGIFSDIAYEYRPGPKRGYILVLTLEDQHAMIPATIDVPEVDDADAWKQVLSLFPTFDRQVPNTGSAQDFMAHEIERLLGPKLHGHHMIAQLESELGPHTRSSLSFHPDVLPQITALKFTGEHEISEGELRGTLLHVIGTDGFMERRFRMAVDFNLRTLYERRGMYRVKFSGIAIERMPGNADAVAVTTSIEEGPQYTLGAVEFSGPGIDAAQLENAGHFKTGKVANWTDIDGGIEAGQRALRQVGYLDTSAKPERVFDDAHLVLSVRVPVDKGPVYHLGQVRFSGLSTEDEAKARLAWTGETGSPYTAIYAAEFYRNFSKVVDVKQWKNWGVKERRMPNHVVDVEVAFEN